MNISFLVWASGVKFAIPTSSNASGLGPQADEYGKKPVSYMAGAIANAAGYFTKIPVIGPYARATEIGARAMGTIATLFGYSKPAQLESSVYKPNTKNDFAMVSGCDDVAKLSVDPKQEITVDPTTVGLANVDEMTINYIAAKESYLETFTWALGTAEETLLWNCIVDPGLHRRAGTGDVEYHLTAPAFVQAPFQFWRGTMMFRIKVVCSKFHKGRLKVVYDPNSTQTIAEYNTAYTTIVDISEETDFVIKVGWGQAVTYRESLWRNLGTPNFDQIQFMNTTALSYNSTSRRDGNGTLAFYVVNELTAPTATDNDIELNVFVSMGPDYEVAAPTQDHIRNMRIEQAPAVRRLQAESESDEEKPGFVRRMLSPQSEEITETPISNAPTEDLKPTQPRSINLNANELPIEDNTNLLHFGESIRSLRSLCKRYSPMENMSKDTGTGSDPRICTYTRPAFPIQPGYTLTALAGGIPPVYITAGLDDYIYANNTFLHWITYSYGGWRGAIRWFADFGTSDSSSATSMFRVQRTEQGDNFPSDGFTTYSGDSTTAAGQSELLDNTDLYGLNGLFHQTRDQNTSAAWEVPYYSQFRFTPAKRKTVYNVADIYQTGWKAQLWNIAFETRAHQFIPTYVAAGDDFSTFFYLGPPIWYHEPVKPV